MWIFRPSNKFCDSGKLIKSWRVNCALSTYVVTIIRTCYTSNGLLTSTNNYYAALKQAPILPTNHNVNVEFRSNSNNAQSVNQSVTICLAQTAWQLETIYFPCTQLDGNGMHRIIPQLPTSTLLATRKVSLQPTPINHVDNSKEN